MRRRKLPGKKKWSAGTCYGITSLTATQASPAALAAMIRGHWLIEDRLHWVRDLDWDEDRSQIRTASAPRVMATLRNLVLTILRLALHASIAAVALSELSLARIASYPSAGRAMSGRTLCPALRAGPLPRS